VTRLHLVRHGTAAARFAEHNDPGLAPEGRAQADEVAGRLEPLGPLPVITSPLRRTRETAAPLVRAWGVEAEVVPAVGEIPTPTNDLDGRAQWLVTALRARWSELPDEVQRWRRSLLDTLSALDHDTVAFTHFVAINAVVGAAEGAPLPDSRDRDAVVCFHPSNGSSTVIEIDGGRFSLVELGAQGVTEVR
jgi:broad specificity phosphatase PhoE